jgi:coenzyme F420-reducing hydrogenase delta subunit
VIEMVRELMDLLGIDRRRLELQWVSSAEGARFAEIVTSFTHRIVELGKSSLGVAA